MVVENMMTTSIIVQLAAIDLINAEVPAVIPTTGYPIWFYYHQYKCSHNEKGNILVLL